MSNKILVIGATGNVGRELVEILAESEEQIKAATRRPGRYQPPADNVEIVAFSYDKPETYAPALEGVDRLFMIPKGLDPRPDELLNPFIDQAREAGVQHIVLMTAMGVNRATEEVGIRRVELHLMASGVGYTILRPNWFMQNFNQGFLLPSIQHSGMFYLPVGRSKTSFIDVTDIAAIAALILSEPEEHQGKEYTLTGGEALSYEEAAEILSEFAEREINYVPISDEDMRRTLLEEGWGHEQVDMVVELLAMARQGAASAVLPTVSELLNREPISFREFARKHAKVWQSKEKVVSIAVIGTGNVGSTLGRRWSQGGHKVIFGSRNPKREAVQRLVELSGTNTEATHIVQAIEKADVVVLATPWSVTQDVIEAAGDLSGKILIDCTNPLRPELDGLKIGLESSAGELIAEWASGARVIKALNSTGVGNMADPLYGIQRATMFICGDDEEAKIIVSHLVEELGFEVIDAGSLKTARYLEPLAMLWIHLAYAEGMGSDIAFKLLRR